MKTANILHITLAVLCLLFTPFVPALAQDAASAYPAAMQTALAQLQQAKSAEELTATINTFSRIGEAMPGEWLPGYYKNLTRLNMSGSFASAKEKDKLLEEVLKEVESLLKQHPNNSELLTLKGYHHMMYVAADPASRGPQFSGLTIQLLRQAMAVDPANPRAYLLLGQMQWGMAQFMNSATDEACALFSRAHELYTSAPKDNTLAPSWGAASAQQLMQRCQSAE
jgi:hypothetical protein